MMFRLLIQKLVTHLVPDDPTGLFRDILYYVLPGVLLFTALDLLRSHWLNNGLNEWAMSNLNWWTVLQRLFFVVEVYLVFVPAVLVGVAHYLRVSGLRLNYRSIFFEWRTFVLVILLAFVFITLSIVDWRLSSVTRPLIGAFGEPVLRALFSAADQQGFWFSLVRGLFATFGSVLAMAPAIYIFARFSFALVRYVSPSTPAGSSSWSLTSGKVGIRLSVLLALTPFVRFVLNQVVFVATDFYLPIQNSNLLEAILFADSAVLQLVQAAYMVLIGAIVATVYRQVAPQSANVPANDE